MVRAAHSLDVALGQLNALAPNRSKLSDGGIGDAAHAARESDHNPDANGVYHARDFTHDPAHGADMSLYPRRLIADQRATYVIFQNTFYDKVNGSIRVRPYPLVNPDGARRNSHGSELHLSVAYGALGDDGRQWEAFTVSRPTPTPSAPGGANWVSLPSLHYGDKSGAVGDLQSFFNRVFPAYAHEHGALVVDNSYGPITTAWVLEYQTRYGIKSDGKDVGPLTKPHLWDDGWRG